MLIDGQTESEKPKSGSLDNAMSVASAADVKMTEKNDYASSLSCNKDLSNKRMFFTRRSNICRDFVTVPSRTLSFM